MSGRTQRQILQYQLEKLTVPYIKDILKELGESCTGRKADLILRCLRRYDVNPREPSLVRHLPTASQPSSSTTPRTASRVAATNKRPAPEPDPIPSKRLRTEPIQVPFPQLVKEYLVPPQFDDPFFQVDPMIINPIFYFVANSSGASNTISFEGSFKIAAHTLASIRHQNRSVHVRCFSAHPTGNTNHHRWPTGLVLRINGFAVTVITEDEKKKTISLPSNILAYLKNDSNTITVSASSLMPHLFTIQATKQRSIEALRDTVTANHVLSKEAAKLRILQSFRSDQELVATHLKVTSLDPLVRCHIKHPVRAKTCKHIQCFDLVNYLRMNESLHNRKWLCPHCNSPASYFDLFVDEYFQDKMENGPETEVHILSNGEWQFPQNTRQANEILDSSEEAQNHEEEEEEEEEDEEDDEDEDEIRYGYGHRRRYRYGRYYPTTSEDEEGDEDEESSSEQPEIITSTFTQNIQTDTNSNSFPYAPSPAVFQTMTTPFLHPLQINPLIQNPALQTVVIPPIEHFNINTTSQALHPDNAQTETTNLNTNTTNPPPEVPNSIAIDDPSLALKKASIYPHPNNLHQRFSNAFAYHLKLKEPDMPIQTVMKKIYEEWQKRKNQPDIEQVIRCWLSDTPLQHPAQPNYDQMRFALKTALLLFLRRLFEASHDQNAFSAILAKASSPQPPIQTTTQASQGSLLIRPPLKYRPKMLLMVGIPGSGKSHLVREMQDSGLKFTWVHFDLLATFAKCEVLSRSALSKGQDVVIDQCSYNPDQRKKWISIGQEFQCEIKCVFLDTPLSICRSRIFVRQDHPAMKPTAESAAIVEQLCSLLIPPRIEEGFAEILGPITNIAQNKDIISKVDKWLSSRSTRQPSSQSLSTLSSPLVPPKREPDEESLFRLPSRLNQPTFIEISDDDD